MAWMDAWAGRLRWAGEYVDWIGVWVLFWHGLGHSGQIVVKQPSWLGLGRSKVMVALVVLRVHDGCG